MERRIVILEEVAFDKLMRKIDNLHNDVKTLLGKSGNSITSRWLITEEVCRDLNISKRRLQQMRSLKEIKYTKIGRKVYYKLADVTSILEAGYNK